MGGIGKPGMAKVGGDRQASMNNHTVMTTGNAVSMQLMSEWGDGQQWQQQQQW